MKSQSYLSKVMGVFAALVMGAVITAQAAAPNVTGTWKWTITGRDGQSRDASIRIKKEGSELVGYMPRPNGGEETKVEGIKVSDDGTIAFSVKRERNGQTFETKYNGKVDGDTIKGQVERQVNGEARKSDWAAKREKSDGDKGAGSANVSGVWNSTFTRQDGTKMEWTIKLKQDGDKVTGSIARQDGNETPLEDGTISGNTVKFTVHRERDGRKITSNYNGKLDGETIKGEVESDFGGDKRTFPFEATKKR